MKEIEDINKRKGIPCTWIRRINTIKLSMLPKEINRTNAISNQNTTEMGEKKPII
jgi:hypothetical protein